MGGRTDLGRNARSLKVFSLLFLALMVASLLLVHTGSYEPGVSYILLYLVSAVGVITAAVLIPLLPAEQFTAGVCGSVYALYAAVLAMMVFFSGGVSSELYIMFFPLLLASALHGSWRVALAVHIAMLFCYALATLWAFLGPRLSARRLAAPCQLSLSGLALPRTRCRCLRMVRLYARSGVLRRLAERGQGADRREAAC